MSTKKGKRAENKLVNAINRNTAENVLALPAGYSGNHVGASPDILIIDTSMGNSYGIELKTHNADQTAKFERGSPDDLEDLDQTEVLLRAGVQMYVAVNWSRSEMAMWEAELPDASLSLEENIPHKFNPRVGEISGHLRVDNPREYDDRGSHPSARSGRDNYKVVLDTLGIPEV